MACSIRSPRIDAFWCHRTPLLLIYSFSTLNSTSHTLFSFSKAIHPTLWLARRAPTAASRCAPHAGKMMQAMKGFADKVKGALQAEQQTATPHSMRARMHAPNSPFSPHICVSARLASELDPATTYRAFCFRVHQQLKHIQTRRQS